ncbi:GDSL-type esterase/lipase family protein [Cellulomonas sp. IC4_254]|uniref:GDSL-type esterase/lipase family protein n=1 Tax=Cellulomonas sp. IC4_254 TaxID=2714040 RepID=UPI0014214CC8|nr:GDSL-type esterase/lipase family protein [Cellulomonas sp. IC4_254]NHT16383.1 lipase [Cellulomonas sp. IC4_254]
MIDVSLADLAALVRGAAETERTPRGLRPHRLPAWVGRQLGDPQLAAMEAQPSGVRLAFTTEATAVEVVVHPTRLAYRQVGRPRGAVDLVVDGVLLGSEPLTGGDAIETDLATGTSALLPGDAQTVAFAGLPAGEKVVEVWLPHNESVDVVALRADAPARPAPDDRPVWLHHGSSISQGSNAATPAGTWPAVAARLGGVDLRNLGLGGSALVDPATARVIRDAPADLISVALGINVVNLDGMRRRTFEAAVHGFLDTIRDGHPDTPLVLVTPIFCGIHEDTPGPGAFDVAALAAGQARFVATGGDDLSNGRLTLRVVRDALATVAGRRADDPHLHLLDGLALYGAADAEEHPLPDALHPDAATHRLIGERFAARAFAADGPFADPRTEPATRAPRGR